MKLTQKLLESVVSEVVGEDVLVLVNMLKTNKNISEFDISTKIKIPVDVIRNQLYRLYNNNLVSFIRKKDKRKGWYIYYWSINLERIKYLVDDLKRKKIEKLSERLTREQESQFFSCMNSCIRVDFEQATNFEYRCPECGELLNQEDNSEKIILLKKEVNEIQKDLDESAKVAAAAALLIEEEPDEEKPKRVKKQANPKPTTKKKATISPIKKTPSKKKVLKKVLNKRKIIVKKKAQQKIKKKASKK